MAVSPSWLRACAAALVTAGLLGLGMGCKGKSNTGADHIVLSGNVTYIRNPLLVGTDGVPTGLATSSSSYETLPGRGALVRVFQAEPQVDVAGNTATAWIMAGSAGTDSNGNYTVANLVEGRPTFVELTSVSTSGGTVKIVGDPAGINSKLPVASRVIYVMRKGLDGSNAATGASTVLNGNTGVDFAVGLSDTWQLSVENWNVPTTTAPYSQGTSNAGSGIMAILDTLFKFDSYYGSPSPGGSLELHYAPGVREPQGTFIDYDRSHYPLSFDGSALHYFGSIAGDTVMNNVTYPGDAFFEGVLYPMLARNYLYAQGKTPLLPVGANLNNLAPTAAITEGFANAMAAGLLQSPYLPDTTTWSSMDPTLAATTPPPARYPAHDIRDLSALSQAQRNEFSAPTITALAWNMLLTANGITLPGTPTDWLNIQPSDINRLYTLINSSFVSGVSTVEDVTSLFTQLNRMQETQASSDALNLASIFPDSVMASLLTNLKFSSAWPTFTTLANLTPTSTPMYTTFWGTDPDTLVAALPAITFSMAQAVPVYGTYPNCTKGEVFNSTLGLSLDRTYDVSFTSTPALPATATLEVTVDGGSGGLYTFGGSNVPSQRIFFSGDPADPIIPTYHYLQIRLVSPKVLQPDLSVTVHLAKGSPTDTTITTSAVSTVQ